MEITPLNFTQAENGKWVAKVTLSEVAGFQIRRPRNASLAIRQSFIDSDDPKDYSTAESFGHQDGPDVFSCNLVSSSYDQGIPVHWLIESGIQPDKAYIIKG